MTRVRAAAGGGRIVEVPAPRVAGWFERFAARHGGATHTEVAPARLGVWASDGASAMVEVPFAPLPEPELGRRAGLDVAPLVAHLARPRLLGLVLVRLGGHSIGLVRDGQVLASVTGHRQVHGRNKAGGWSQQRFARRREGQAERARQAAAHDIARLLCPRVAELDAVVLGGDARTLALLRADTTLAAVFALAQPRVLDVPEPRRSVLAEAVVRACGVEITVREP